MASMTLTHGATPMSAARSTAVTAVRERYGVSPMTTVQGTGVPFAGPISALAAHAAQTKNVVDRKADGWVPPRGRSL